MSKIEPNKPERFNDTGRNLILNRALDSIERIVTEHDPEVHCPLGHEVWNRLDEMALKIEAKIRAEYEAPCETCKGDAEICADVPSLRHCEKAIREANHDQ